MLTEIVAVHQGMIKSQDRHARSTFVSASVCSREKRPSRSVTGKFVIPLQNECELPIISSLTKPVIAVEKNRDFLGVH